MERERENLVLKQMEEEVSVVVIRPGTCLLFGLFCGARKSDLVCPY